ncbi:hypothetical protein pdam_00002518, partial [Pocillopora damicornis]
MAGASLWGITFKNIPKKPVSFIHIASCRCFSVGKQRRHQDNTQFDQKYDNARNELISDDIGVAYSIQNGIPNLIPHDGRLIKKDNTTLIKDKDLKNFNCERFPCYTAAIKAFLCVTLIPWNQLSEIL